MALFDEVWFDAEKGHIVEGAEQLGDRLGLHTPAAVWQGWKLDRRAGNRAT